MDTAVNYGTLADQKTADAADGFPGAVEFAAGVAGECDGLPFRGGLTCFRIGYFDFMVLFTGERQAVDAAREFKVRVAGHSFVVFGDGDACERAAGDDHVHERSGILFGNGGIDRCQFIF